MRLNPDLGEGRGGCTIGGNLNFHLSSRAAPQHIHMQACSSFDIGSHQLTLFAVGYFGRSMIPGLVPVGVPGLHDTIDPRQKDQTHTALAALADTWHLSEATDIRLAGFFRTYNL